MPEPKEMTDLMQTAVHEFREAVKRQDEEIRKYGESSAETTQMVEKLNGRISELEEKVQKASLPDTAPPEPTEESKNKSANEAFHKFVRYGRGSLNPEERKALVEDTTGGYLITPELDSEIVRTLPQLTIMRPLCAQRTIGKDSLKIRSVAEVSVGWGKLETGAEITGSSPVPSAPTYQYVEDLYALAKIGEDELQDSDINLTELLADQFSRAIAEAEEAGFVTGAGHSSEEPEGFTKNATLIGNTVTTASSGAVMIEEFLDMVYQCPTQYRKNGVFVMSSAVELAVRKLRAVDGSGTNYGPFLWQPSVQQGKPAEFIGYPTYAQDDMSDLSDVESVIAAFGDFKAGYRILDRKGMSIQRLSELYAESGMVGFKIHKRVGGAATRAANQPIVLLTENA